MAYKKEGRPLNINKKRTSPVSLAKQLTRFIKCVVRIGAAAPGRAPCPGRPSALKKAIRGFADKPGDIVIVPAFGTSFDTLGEAYDFDHLYSWEKGFGIRYGKSRLNVERTKCMQEIVCGCAGKAGVVNTRSCWCECPALVKLAYKEQLFFQVEMQLLGFRTMMQVQQTRLGTRSMDCWHKRSGRRWGVQQLAERRRHTRGSAN